MKRSNGGNSKHDDDVYLETDEQDKVIAELRSGMKRNNERWKMILTIIGLLLSLFVAFYGNYSDDFMHIWDNKSNSTIVLLRSLLSLSILVTICSIHFGDIVVKIACIVVIVCQLFCIHYSVWPYGAIGLVYFITIYISIHDESSIEKELSNLEHLKYDFKKV